MFKPFVNGRYKINIKEIVFGDCILQFCQKNDVSLLLLAISANVKRIWTLCLLHVHCFNLKKWDNYCAKTDNTSVALEV